MDRFQHIEQILIVLLTPGPGVGSSSIADYALEEQAGAVAILRDDMAALRHRLVQGHELAALETGAEPDENEERGEG